MIDHTAVGVSFGVVATVTVPSPLEPSSPSHSASSCSWRDENRIAPPADFRAPLPQSTDVLLTLVDTIEASHTHSPIDVVLGATLRRAKWLAVRFLSDLPTEESLREPSFGRPSSSGGRLSITKGVGNLTNISFCPFCYQSLHLYYLGVCLAFLLLSRVSCRPFAYKWRCPSLLHRKTSFLLPRVVFPHQLKG